jgi:hypothetical protein
MSGPGLTTGHGKPGRGLIHTYQTSQGLVVRSGGLRLLVTFRLLSGLVIGFFLFALGLYVLAPAKAEVAADWISRAVARRLLKAKDLTDDRLPAVSFFVSKAGESEAVTALATLSTGAAAQGPIQADSNGFSTLLFAASTTMDLETARKAVLEVRRVSPSLDFTTTAETAATEHCTECLLVLSIYRVWSSTDNPLQRAELRQMLSQGAALIQSKVEDQQRKTGDLFLPLESTSGTETVALTLHQAQAIAALRASSIILGQGELAVLAAKMLRTLHRFYSSNNAAATAPAAGTAAGSTARFDGQGAFHLGLKMSDDGEKSSAWKPLRAATTSQALILLYLEPGDLPKQIIGKVAASALSLETPVGLKTGKTLKPVTNEAARTTARKKAVVDGDAKWQGEEVASIIPVYFVSPLEQAATLLGAAKHLRAELAALVKRKEAEEKSDLMQDLMGNSNDKENNSEEPPAAPVPVPEPSDSEEEGEEGGDASSSQQKKDSNDKSLLDSSTELDRKVAAELLSLAEQVSIKRSLLDDAEVAAAAAAQKELDQDNDDEGEEAEDEEKDAISGFEGLVDDETPEGQLGESQDTVGNKPSLSFSLLQHLIEATLRVNMVLERLEMEASHRLWGRKVWSGQAAKLTGKEREISEGELAHAFTYPSLLAVLHSGPLSSSGQKPGRVNSPIGMTLLRKRRGSFYASKETSMCPCWSLNPLLPTSSVSSSLCNSGSSASASAPLPVIEVDARLHTPLAMAEGLYQVDTATESGSFWDASSRSPFPEVDQVRRLASSDLFSNTSVVSADTLSGTSTVVDAAFAHKKKGKAVTVAPGAAPPPTDVPFLTYTPQSLIWRPTSSAANVARLPKGQKQAQKQQCMEEEHLVLDILLSKPAVADSGSQNDDEDGQDEVAVIPKAEDAVALAKRRSREKLAEAAGVVLKAAKKGLRKAAKVAKNKLRKGGDASQGENDEEEQENEEEEQLGDLTVPRVILRGYGRPFDIGTASAAKFFKRLFVAGKSTAFRRWEEELAEKALVAEHPDEKDEPDGWKKQGTKAAALFSSFLGQVRSLVQKHSGSNAEEEARMDRFIMASGSIPRVTELLHPLLVPSGELGAVFPGPTAPSTPASSFVRQFSWIDESERLNAAKALEGKNKSNKGKADEDGNEGEGEGFEEAPMADLPEAQSRPIEGVDEPVKLEDDEDGENKQVEGSHHPSGTVDPAAEGEGENEKVTAAPIVPAVEGEEEQKVEESKEKKKEKEKADDQDAGAQEPGKKDEAAKAEPPKQPQPKKEDAKAPVSKAETPSQPATLAINPSKLYQRICAPPALSSASSNSQPPCWYEQCCVPLKALADTKSKDGDAASAVVLVSSLPTFTCSKNKADKKASSSRSLPCSYILDGFCDCAEGLDEPQSTKAVCNDGGLFRCGPKGAFAVSKGSLEHAPENKDAEGKAQASGLLPLGYLSSEASYEQLMKLQPHERASLGFIDASKVKDGVKDCVDGEDEADDKQEEGDKEVEVKPPAKEEPAAANEEAKQGVEAEEVEDEQREDDI